MLEEGKKGGRGCQNETMYIRALAELRTDVGT